VLGLFNGSNQVVNQYRYLPFGEPESGYPQEAIGNILKFQAREFDAYPRLYYFRARWYDPDLARFVSEDPIRLAGGINPYAFAHNNPASFRDPSGLLPCDIMMGTGACFYTELPGVTGGYRRKPAPGDEDPDYVCRTYGYCGMPSNDVPNTGGPVGTPTQPASTQPKPTQSRSVEQYRRDCRVDLGRAAIDIALVATGMTWAKALESGKAYVASETVAETLGFARTTAKRALVAGAGMDARFDLGLSGSGTDFAREFGLGGWGAAGFAIAGLTPAAPVIDVAKAAYSCWNGYHD
jgi:RHS repeat-associated protein